MKAHLNKLSGIYADIRESRLKSFKMAVPMSPLEAATVSALHTMPLSEEVHSFLVGACQDGLMQRALAFNIPATAFAAMDGGTLGSIDNPVDLRFHVTQGEARRECCWSGRRDNISDEDSPALNIPPTPVVSHDILLKMLFLYATKTVHDQSVCSSNATMATLAEKMRTLSNTYFSDIRSLRDNPTQLVPMILIEEIPEHADADDIAFATAPGKAEATRINTAEDPVVYRVWLFVPEAYDKHPETVDGSPMPSVIYNLLKRAADINYSFDYVTGAKQRKGRGAAKQKDSRKGGKKGKRNKRKRGEELADDLAEEYDGDADAMEVEEETPAEAEVISQLSDEDRRLLELLDAGPKAIVLNDERHPLDEVGSPYTRLAETPVQIFNCHHVTGIDALADLAAELPVGMAQYDGTGRLVDQNRWESFVRSSGTFVPRAYEVENGLALLCCHINAAVAEADVQTVTWLTDPDVVVLDEVDPEDDPDQFAPRVDLDATRGIRRADVRRYMTDAAGNTEEQDGADPFALAECFGRYNYAGEAGLTGYWEPRSAFVSSAIRTYSRAVNYKFYSRVHDDDELGPINICPRYTLDDGQGGTETIQSEPYVSPLHESAFFNPSVAMATYACRNLDARQLHYMNYFCPREHVDTYRDTSDGFTWRVHRRLMHRAHQTVPAAALELVETATTGIRTRGDGIALIAKHALGHSNPHRQVRDFRGFPVPSRVTLLMPSGTLPWVAPHIPLPGLLRKNPVLRNASEAIAYNLLRTQKAIRAQCPIPGDTYHPNEQDALYRELEGMLKTMPRDHPTLRNFEIKSYLMQLQHAYLQLCIVQSVDTLAQSAEMFPRLGVRKWNKVDFASEGVGSSAAALLKRKAMRCFYPFTDVMPPEKIRHVCEVAHLLASTRITRAMSECVFSGMRPTINITAVPAIRPIPVDPVINARGYNSIQHFLDQNNGMYNMAMRNQTLFALASQMFAVPTGHERTRFIVMDSLRKTVTSGLRETGLHGLTGLFECAEHLIQTPRAFKAITAEVRSPASRAWPRTATGTYSNLSAAASNTVGFCLYLAQARGIFNNVMPCLLIRDTAVSAAQFHEEGDFQAGFIVLAGPAAVGKSVSVREIMYTLPGELYCDITASTAKSLNIEADSTGNIFYANEMSLSTLSQDKGVANNELVTMLKAMAETGYVATEAFNADKRQMDAGQRNKRMYFHATQGARITCTNHDFEKADAAWKSRLIPVYINPPIIKKSIEIEEPMLMPDGTPTPAPSLIADTGIGLEFDDDDGEEDVTAPPPAKRRTINRRPATVKHTVPMMNRDMVGAALQRVDGSTSAQQLEEVVRDFKLQNVYAAVVYYMIQARILPHPELTEAKDLIAAMLPCLTGASLTGFSSNAVSTSGDLVRLMGHIRNYLTVRVILNAVSTITTPTFSHYRRHYMGTNKKMRPFDVSILAEHVPPRLFATKEDVVMTLTLLRDQFDKHLVDAVMTALADLMCGPEAGEPLYYNVTVPRAQVIRTATGTAGDPVDVGQEDHHHHHPPYHRGGPGGANGGGAGGGGGVVQQYDMNYQCHRAGQGRMEAAIGELAKGIVNRLRSRATEEQVRAILMGLRNMQVTIDSETDLNPPSPGDPAAVQATDPDEIAAFNAAAEYDDYGDDAGSAISSASNISSTSAQIMATPPVVRHHRAGGLMAGPLPLNKYDPLGIMATGGAYVPRTTKEKTIELVKIHVDKRMGDVVYIVVNRQALKRYRERSRTSGELSNTRIALLSVLSHAALEKYPEEVTRALQRVPDQRMKPLVDHLQHVEASQTHAYPSAYYGDTGILVARARTEWKTRNSAELAAHGIHTVPVPPPQYEFMSMLECKRTEEVLQLKNEYLPNYDAIRTLFHTGYTVSAFSGDEASPEKRARLVQRDVKYDTDFEAYSRNCERMGLDKWDPNNLMALPVFSGKHLDMLNREQNMVPTAPQQVYPMDAISQRVSRELDDWLHRTKSQPRKPTRRTGGSSGTGSVSRRPPAKRAAAPKPYARH